MQRAMTATEPTPAPDTLAAPAPDAAPATAPAAAPEPEATATAPAAATPSPSGAGETATVEAPGPDAPAAPPVAQAKVDLSPAACAERLRALFPALFAGPAKPIKLRIQADIQARAPGEFTKATLSAFLRRHTGSTGYLIALTKAPQRLDLDGQPAGEISAEHRQAAIDELARRRQVQEQRRHAEEDQRRERAQLLRAFRSTTLTKENFCALKGMAPEALDAALALAEQEAQQAPPQRPWSGDRPRHAPGGPRRDEGAPRRDGRDGRDTRDARGGRGGPAPGRPADARGDARRDGPRGPRPEGQGERPAAGPRGPRPPKPGP
jgi:ProP effector